MTIFLKVVRIALAGFATLSLAGCGGGDGTSSPKNVSPPLPPVPPITAQMLIGTWPIASVTNTNAGTTVKTVCANYPVGSSFVCSTEDFLRFNADGTYLYHHVVPNHLLTEHEGTWSISKDQATLTPVRGAADLDSNGHLDASEYFDETKERPIVKTVVFSGANSFTSQEVTHSSPQPQYDQVGSRTTVYTRPAP